MTTRTLASVQSKNRLYLLFIIALFTLPLAVAWLLVEQWRPAGTTHHGELLNPAQPLLDFVLHRLDGETVGDRYLQGHWTLAVLGESPSCEQTCETSLYNVRQVQLALGKNMDRTQTLLMLTQAPDTQMQQWLHQEHKAMTVGVVDNTTTALFRRVFDDGLKLGYAIYLIDPLGNLFMRYDPDSNPKGILQDLKRVLKFSKIG